MPVPYTQFHIAYISKSYLTYTSHANSVQRPSMCSQIHLTFNEIKKLITIVVVITVFTCVNNPGSYLPNLLQPLAVVAKVQLLYGLLWAGGKPFPNSISEAVV